MDSGNFCYEYPRPAVTTDCAVFSFDNEDINILLIQRKLDPYKGRWALPGGFMQMDETAEECARRELFEETGFRDIELEQLYTFTDVDRDPRGRTISIAYVAIVDASDRIITAGDDAENAQWFSLKSIPELAFDHDLILKLALEKTRENK
ncbi:MAG: NUDIX domain-containing protein [Methanosarcina sp.]